MLGASLSGQVARDGAGVRGDPQRRRRVCDGGGCIPGDLEKIKAGGEERRNVFLFLFMIICKERRKKPDEGER